jgi:hypothetical protein
LILGLLGRSAEHVASQAKILAMVADRREKRSVNPIRNGAPRPMKMGAIASPWRYDGVS